MEETSQKTETKAVQSTLYDPHSVPFLSDAVDEDGVILLSREDILASAIHMLIHVVLETAPSYGNLIDVLKAGVEKAPTTKTYTKEEMRAVLDTLASVYVKMIDMQSKSINEITNQIPKKEAIVARPPPYIM